MTDYDIRKLVGKDVAQTDRRVQWSKIVDFSEQNLALNDTAKFLTLRKGFVFERCDTFLLTAEGGAGTINIGITGDTDGFLDGGDVNGTPNAKIALGAGATIAAGALYAADTDVFITAEAALDAGKILVVFNGYMVDLP